MEIRQVLVSFFILLSLNGVGCKSTPKPHVQTERRKDATPTRLTERNPGLLREQSDLRALVCDWDVLRDRIDRGVCLIDPRGLGSPPMELDLDKGSSLHALLQKAGISPNVHLQLRLITKEHILQVGRAAGSKANAIWNLVVEPGDIIVLPGRRM